MDSGENNIKVNCSKPLSDTFFFSYATNHVVQMETLGKMQK
jgi:hypothetical protein